MLDRVAKRAHRFDQAALGVFGQNEALDGSGWISQCRLNGVKAKEPQRSLASFLLAP